MSFRISSGFSSPRLIRTVVSCTPMSSLCSSISHSTCSGEVNTAVSSNNGNGRLSGQIVVRHGTYTGVRPHIFCRFYHVDYGVDGKYQPKNFHWSTDSRHQRECEEKTSHRYSSIANSRNDRNQNPQQDS